MEKQPKINNNEELYQKHKESAEEIKKAQEHYDDIIRENQEASNIEIHPEILEEATSLYQEWGKEQLAKALEKKDFERAKEIIIGLEQRQKTVEKSETPNKIFTEIENDSKGKPMWSWEFENDKKGKRTKEVKKDLKGNPIMSREYKRDDKGNIIEEVKKDSEGKPLESWEYEYDHKGNNRIMSREYKHDDKGNRIEKTEKNYKGQGYKVRVL